MPCDLRTKIPEEIFKQHFEDLSHNGRWVWSKSREALQDAVDRLEGESRSAIHDECLRLEQRLKRAEDLLIRADARMNILNYVPLQGEIAEFLEEENT